MDTLIIILLLVLMLPQLVKLWFRWWIGRRLGQAAGTKTEKPRPEGEVRVERGNTPRKRVNKDVGDYVEFEEEVER